MYSSWRKQFQNVWAQWENVIYIYITFINLADAFYLKLKNEEYNKAIYPVGSNIFLQNRGQEQILVLINNNCIK